MSSSAKGVFPYFFPRKKKENKGCEVFWLAFFKGGKIKKNLCRIIHVLVSDIRCGSEM